jgi:hypothetical protein
LTGSFLIEIAKYTDAEEDHDESEHDKPRSMAKQGPITGEVGFEKRKLGEYEETCTLLVVSPIWRKV